MTSFEQATPPVVAVKGVSKGFRLYAKPLDRLKEVILRRSYHQRHEALRDISFDIRPGETLGILGKNGAGKSTLLKLLTGVLLPDSGQINCYGKIAGLLELGAGFDFNLNGIQNIRINGLLLGMTDDEINRLRDEIIEFSELGKYIHEPLRTYSSGMVMRLAFAIGIHASPQCFVIDEALSVGDGRFQQKCIQRIKQFKQQGGAIIFVSHDMNAIKMLCDETIVLEQGKVVYRGAPAEGVNYYYRIMSAAEDQAMLAIDSQDHGHQYGNRKVVCDRVSLIGLGSGSHSLTCGEQAQVDVVFSAQETVMDLTVGIMLRDRFGQDLYGTNTHLLGHELIISAGERKCMRFSFDMHLAPGVYTLSVSLHSQQNHTEDCYHWWDDAVGFEVAGTTGTSFAGVCNLQAQADVVVSKD